MGNLHNLVVAIKALVAAKAVIDESSDNNDSNGTADSLKWAISDLKRVLASEYAFQKALQEGAVAGILDTVLTEVGARLSNDTKSALQDALDILKKLFGDEGNDTTPPDAGDVAESFKAITETITEADTLVDDEYESWDVGEAAMDAKTRNKLDAAQFADPKNRKYPIHDKAHADNAAARLAQQLKQGKITQAYYNTVIARVHAAQKKFKDTASEATPVVTSAMSEYFDNLPLGVRKIRESAVLLGESSQSSNGTAFDMLVIAAGMSKNRVNYPADALRRSMHLLEDRPIYVDHPDASGTGERSMRDKVGWWSNPRYAENVKTSNDSETVSGIVATANLYVNSPQPWFREMVKEALERDRPQDIGISILAGGKTTMKRDDGGVYKEVEEIQVYASADAVAEPGAGGRPLALVASERKDHDVDVLKNAKTLAEIIAALPDLTIKEIKTARPDLFNEDGTPKNNSATETTTKVKESTGTGDNTISNASDSTANTGDAGDADDVANAGDVATLREGLAEMQRYQTQQTLDRILAESGVPQSLWAKIREKVGDRIVTETALRETVQEYLDILNAAQPAPEVTGAPIGAGLSVPFGSAQTGPTTVDRVQAALDQWFGAPIEDKELAASTPRIGSFREFYVQVTGDYAFEGVYRPENSILREALPGATHVVGGGTITMANLLGTSMNRALTKKYQDQPKWWEPIVGKADLNDMKQQDRTLLHNFGSLSERSTDGAEYTELDWGETNESYTPTEYGNLVTVGRRAIINDNLRGIQQLPALLASSAVLTLNEYISNLFTQNSGAGPALADSNNVFDAANHQSNSQTYPLTRGNLIALMKILMKMNNAASKRIGIIPRHLLVPVDLFDTAWELVNSPMVPDSANRARNLIADSDVSMDAIRVPNWTDANNWYIMADPSQIVGIELGFLFGKEVPDLLSQQDPSTGMVWTNDVLSWKVRHDYGADWIDYRAAAASIVA